MTLHDLARAEGALAARRRTLLEREDFRETMRALAWTRDEKQPPSNGAWPDDVEPDQWMQDWLDEKFPVDSAPTEPASSPEASPSVQALRALAGDRT